MTFSETVAKLFRKEDTNKYMPCFTLFGARVGSGILKDYVISNAEKIKNNPHICLSEDRIRSITYNKSGSFVRIMRRKIETEKGRHSLPLILNGTKEDLHKFLDFHKKSCTNIAFSTCEECLLFLASYNIHNESAELMAEIISPWKPSSVDKNWVEGLFFIKEGKEVILPQIATDSGERTILVRCVPYEDRTSIEFELIPTDNM